MHKRALKLISAFAVSTLGSVQPASAAKPAKVPTAAPTAAPTTAASQAAPAAPIEWVLNKTFEKWGLICNKANAKDCRAVQTQNYDNAATKGRLLQAVVSVERDRTFLILTLPFGVDLRGGLVARIDENEEVKSVFMTCLPDGCQSIIELDAKLLSQFVSGKLMKVGFRPWGGENTLVVDVPLEGAKEAVAALKL